MQKTDPNCHVCKEGDRKRKKKYRMSAPVVLIGYILLVPCVIGMLLGFLLLLGTGASSADFSQTTRNEIRAQLVESRIPDGLIDQLLSGDTISESERQMLTSAQRTRFEDARLNYLASQAGSGAATVLAGGFSLFMIVSAFVGGLLGWLLIMKKKVLQCGNCGAVVNAS